MQSLAASILDGGSAELSGSLVLPRGQSTSGALATRRLSPWPFLHRLFPTLESDHGGRRTELGSPTKSFCDSWRTAIQGCGPASPCVSRPKEACSPDMAETIGMLEKHAMEISGHKTPSLFERYHIMQLADIQESHHKMDEWANTAVVGESVGAP